MRGSQLMGLSIAVFVGMSVLIAWQGNVYHGLVINLRKTQDHSQLLLRELQHRGKNTLMVVQAVVSQTLPRGPDKEKVLSLEIAHHLLARSDRFSFGI